MATHVTHTALPIHNYISLLSLSHFHRPLSTLTIAIPVTVSGCFPLVPQPVRQVSTVHTYITFNNPAGHTNQPLLAVTDVPLAVRSLVYLRVRSSLKEDDKGGKSGEL